MSFSLSLSHVGIYVTDIERMVDFYTRFLGFAESDRGPTPGGGQIVFLTRDPREHHQFVLATGRPKDLAYNLINQLSFRVDSVDTLREVQKGLSAEGVHELGPVTHGNALSLYFRDPEGNRVELLIDTPWYVPQPCRIPVDLAVPDEELWASIERKARALPGFKSREAWQRDIEEKITRATSNRRVKAAAAT